MITIILAILIVFLFYLGNRWITKNAYHDPIENTFYIHERLHGDPDEHDPQNLDLDNSLKMAKLQKDLREIDDVNIDYSNYEGK
jgi:cell division protein FtsX